jgi:hypothetical protein
MRRAPGRARRRGGRGDGGSARGHGRGGHRGHEGARTGDGAADGGGGRAGRRGGPRRRRRGVAAGGGRRPARHGRVPRRGRAGGGDPHGGDRRLRRGRAPRRLRQQRRHPRPRGAPARHLARGLGGGQRRQPARRLPRLPRRDPRDAGHRRRQHRQRRVDPVADRRPVPHLVHRHQARGARPDPGARGGLRRRRHPRQLRPAGGHGDADDPRVLRGQRRPGGDAGGDGGRLPDQADRTAAGGRPGGAVPRLAGVVVRERAELLVDGALTAKAY